MQSNEMKFNFQLKFDSLFEFSSPAYDDRQISWLLTEAQYRVFIRHYNPLGNKYQKGFENDEQRRKNLEQFIESASISGAGFTGAISYTGDFEIGSNIISNISSTTGLNKGLVINVDIATLPANTVIDYIIDDSTIQVSANALADSTDTEFLCGIGKSAHQGGVHKNGTFLDLPSNFLYAIEESVITSATSNEEVFVLPVRHDQYRANIRHPYKKPYTNLVWRMDFSKETKPIGTDSTGSSKRTELITDGSTISEYRVRYLQSPPDIVVDEVTPANQVHCILDETIHREIVDEAVVIARAAVDQEKYQLSVNEGNRSE